MCRATLSRAFARRASAIPLTEEVAVTNLQSRPTARPLEHIDALDGLRFLAAATVLIGHSWNCLVKPHEFDFAFRHSPLTLLINGYGAVHLFFILSGFCLSGSADRVRGLLDLAQFYIRRIFRIHPPYMYALLAAWIMSFFYDVSRAAGGVGKDAFEAAGVHLSPRELLPYFLYPSYAANQLNPAWTLTIEMNFSFLLPLMLWVTRTTHWTMLIVASLYAIFRPSPVASYFTFALYFSIGIAIYQEQARLGSLAARLPNWAQHLFVFAGLLVFASPWMLNVVFRPDWTYRPLGLLLSAAGGTLLLCAALFLPAPRRLLSSRWLVYGGKRSYSFYLFHFPVMLLCARLIRGPASWIEGLLFISLVFALTSIAAVFSFAAIERPSIRAGNHLCNVLGRRGKVQVSRLA
jgi:peptidoglycan/LPS O-acetylase OafA/YrhL